MKRRTPSSPPSLPPRQARYLLPIALGLFCLIAATFWSALDHDFINYDDPDYVTTNPHVQQGLTWSGVRWAFASSNETGNWHPVTWLSHMLDYDLVGARPAGHHRTSVLLHALNAVLLFLLLHYLTGRPWRSLAVAALFGLHPLRVESVAWVAERKDVLSGFFFLLTLLAYVKYVARVEGRGTGAGQPKGQSPESKVGGVVQAPRATLHTALWYALALGLFALGLMSKPMLVTLPFVLWLLDYWPLRRLTFPPTRRVWVEKIPFLLLAGACSLLTLFTQHAGGAMLHSQPLPLRLQTAAVAAASYLGDLFWPRALAVHYPYPSHWPAGAVVGAVALLVVVSVLVLLARQRRPYLLFGWAWYLGMLLPVIGVVQVGLQARADRYTYLPLIGGVLLLVWAAAELTQAWRRQALVLGTALGLAGLACIGLTRHQLAFWQDSGTLFQRALEVSPHDNIALMHLANYRRQQGRLDEAIALYRQAVVLDPLMEEPQLNLGVLLCMSGQLEPGLQQLQQALRVLPNSALLHGNLGLFLLKQNQLQEAEDHLQTAVRLQPNYPEAQVLLGDICLKSGHAESARAHYQQALQLRPDFAPALHRLQSLPPP